MARVPWPHRGAVGRGQAGRAARGGRRLAGERLGRRDAVRGLRSPAPRHAGRANGGRPAAQRSAGLPGCAAGRGAQRRARAAARQAVHGGQVPQARQVQDAPRRDHRRRGGAVLRAQLRGGPRRSVRRPRAGGRHGQRGRRGAVHSLQPRRGRRPVPRLARRVLPGEGLALAARAHARVGQRGIRGRPPRRRAWRGPGRRGGRGLCSSGLHRHGLARAQRGAGRAGLRRCAGPRPTRGMARAGGRRRLRPPGDWRRAGRPGGGLLRRGLVYAGGLCHAGHGAPSRWSRRALRGPPAAGRGRHRVFRRARSAGA
mmetsp:Transcript_6372/g.16274  ORF Transcript_6372/g.16274 Transcript_6372/m.16274 type:complete len:313 (-) Transcript_6372:362-1300(-)